MKLKKGDTIKVRQTESILQKHQIEGNVVFDSWEDEEKLYVMLPNEPAGKRFMIHLKDIDDE
jgi:hypothetical protein